MTIYLNDFLENILVVYNIIFYRAYAECEVFITSIQFYNTTKWQKIKSDKNVH